MVRYLYLRSNIVAVQHILFYMTIKANLLYSIKLMSILTYQSPLVFLACNFAFHKYNVSYKYSQSVINNIFLFHDFLMFNQFYIIV